MSGEWFLWIGFVGSLVWHLVSWFIYIYPFSYEGQGFEDAVVTTLQIINFGLSGISFCLLGYLLFG